MQILSVERRRLTIVLMYGIITAEKEFLRSRIFDFLIASISHRNGLDHIFDHLRLWTTWKQCPQEHPKASISDSKVPKSLVNQAKNRCRFVWDAGIARSSRVTPTKIGFESNSQSLLSLPTATQILRADSFSSVSPRSFSLSRLFETYQLYFSVHFIGFNHCNLIFAYCDADIEYRYF